jgi:hypothetical protein
MVTAFGLPSRGMRGLPIDCSTLLQLSRATGLSEPGCYSPTCHKMVMRVRGSIEREESDIYVDKGRNGGILDERELELFAASGQGSNARPSHGAIATGERECVPVSTQALNHYDLDSTTLTL